MDTLRTLSASKKQAFFKHFLWKFLDYVEQQVPKLWTTIQVMSESCNTDLNL